MKPRSVMTEVEAEYGEPFWDVVKHYADSGESITATAAILGYGGHAPFLRLVKRHGRVGWFKKGIETNGAIAQRQNLQNTPGRVKALSAARKANPGYIWLYWDGVRDTIAGHAKRIGMCRHVAYRRLKKGMSLDKVFNPVSYRRAPPKQKPSCDHPWNRESL